MTKQNKKVTVGDILKARKVIKEEKKKDFYSEVFEGYIEIKDISPQKLVSIVNGANADEAMRADYELIYESCPIFSTKELHDSILEDDNEEDLKDPILIVEKAFCGNVNEIDRLAKFIMKRYGYYTDIESVKKQ